MRLGEDEYQYKGIVAKFYCCDCKHFATTKKCNMTFAYCAACLVFEPNTYVAEQINKAMARRKTRMSVKRKKVYTLGTFLGNIKLKKLKDKAKVKQQFEKTLKRKNASLTDIVVKYATLVKDEVKIKKFATYADYWKWFKRRQNEILTHRIISHEPKT